MPWSRALSALAVMYAGVVLWSADASAADLYSEPSFDCAKASGVVERLICEVPDFISDDRAIADAAHVAGVPDAEQRKWFAERNENCGRLVGTNRPSDLVLPSDIVLASDTDPVVDCVIQADRDRLKHVLSIPVGGPNAPTRFPYLPHLTADQAPDVCRALEAAERESFKTVSPKISAIDRAWPGKDVTWVFSPATLGRYTSALFLARPVDLDADGHREMLVLMSRPQSWQGDVFSLVRFASEADVKDFENRENKSSPGKGESILPDGAGGHGDPFPSDWHFPSVLAADGQYYLLDEGGALDGMPPARLYRIPATGAPQQLCTVERRPSKMQDWDSRAGAAEVFSDARAIVGGAAWCGTLNAAGRLADAAEMVRSRAILRPWATDIAPFNSQRMVDLWLERWATEGLRNAALYARIKADEPKALEALATWYATAFGIADASTEAHRVWNLTLRAQFAFPTDGPNPSPLAAALLRGAPAAEVDPLLATVDLNRAMDDGEDAPLVLALRHPHLVRLLLAAGAAVNSENTFGKTPLMYAAQIDSAEAVRLLLASGAAVNAKTRSLHRCAVDVSRGDRTALHYAAESAGLDVIRLLVEAGAETTAPDKPDNRSPSQTPTDYLARNTKLSVNDRQEALRLLGGNH